MPQETKTITAEHTAEVILYLLLLGAANYLGYLALLFFEVNTTKVAYILCGSYLCVLLFAGFKLQQGLNLAKERLMRKALIVGLTYSVSVINELGALLMKEPYIREAGQLFFVMPFIVVVICSLWGSSANLKMLEKLDGFKPRHAAARVIFLMAVGNTPDNTIKDAKDIWWFGVVALVALLLGWYLVERKPEDKIEALQA